MDGTLLAAFWGVLELLRAAGVVGASDAEAGGLGVVAMVGALVATA